MVLNMPTIQNVIKTIRSLAVFIRYNAINVFAGRFIYFLAFAVALFLTVVIIHTFEEDAPPGAEAIYYFLLTPGVLLVFYPSAYSIQSDVDSRMIETLFGIPDYRYKVWLARSANLLDVFQKRFQEKSVRRLEHHQADPIPPSIPSAAQFLGFIQVNRYMYSSDVIG